MTTARSSRAQAKAAAQPFNVGKYSKVSKASAADLALDAEDIKPTPATSRTRRSIGGAAASGSKGKVIKKEAVGSDFEDVEADQDYAMDSDAEERQLKAAIQASAARGMEDKFGSASSTAMTSRASSVGKGKAKGPAKRESLGKRAAVQRSAESECFSSNSLHLCLRIVAPTELSV